jgi:hypothetical protein
MVDVNVGVRRVINYGNKRQGAEDKDCRRHSQVVALDPFVEESKISPVLCAHQAVDLEFIAAPASTLVGF